jgi:hypothetical protein
MRPKQVISVFVVGMLALGGGIMPAAYATSVNWADWTLATSGTVIGSIGSVNVTYSGAPPVFTQLNNTGTDYWTEGMPTLHGRVGVKRTGYE